MEIRYRVIVVLLGKYMQILYVVIVVIFMQDVKCICQIFYEYFNVMEIIELREIFKKKRGLFLLKYSWKIINEILIK